MFVNKEYFFSNCVVLPLIRNLYFSHKYFYFIFLCNYVWSFFPFHGSIHFLFDSKIMLLTATDCSRLPIRNMTGKKHMFNTIL